jgi:hypothetical protein
VVAVSIELPPAAAEEAALANILRAVLRATQDLLQEALDDEVAAAAFAGNATLAVTRAAAQGGASVYTFSVGLPPALQLAPLRRSRALAAGADGCSKGPLEENGMLRQRLAEAGVPGVDALFDSGALSVCMETVAPPPPAAAAAAAPRGSDALFAALISVFCALLLIAAALVAFSKAPALAGFAPSAEPAARPEDLVLREAPAAPAAPPQPDELVHVSVASSRPGERGHTEYELQIVFLSHHGEGRGKAHQYRIFKRFSAFGDADEALRARRGHAVLAASLPPTRGAAGAAPGDEAAFLRQRQAALGKWLDGFVALLNEDAGGVEAEPEAAALFEWERRDALAAKTHADLYGDV